VGVSGKGGAPGSVEVEDIPLFLSIVPLLALGTNWKWD
jgi:hypothetical protein